MGAADAVEQRCLARAVRADEDAALPDRDVKTYIRYCAQAAEDLADPGQHKSR
jgi:hypothetical protein